MIIGHYDSELWSKGGISSYIRRVSRAQRAAGHQVYYFSFYPCHDRVEDPAEEPQMIASDTDLFEQAQSLRLDVLHLHKPISTPPPDELCVLRTVHGHQPYCPSGSKFLKRWNKPCDRPYSLLGCLWGHYIDHCGSIRPKTTQFNFQYTNSELSILLTMPVITVSQFLKDQMVKAGYAADSIHVLHLPAPDRFSEAPPPQHGTPRFVVVGRIAPEKGMGFLLQALQQVTVPIHLDIVGEGYYESDLRDRVRQLGMDDRVTFHGWVNSDQALDLMQNARAVIFPSIWHEPAGFISLEAATVSRAVIGTRVGGIPEYTGLLQNALLVEPDNQPELAAAITRLATDWNVAMHLGQQGREQVAQHFSGHQHLEQLIQVYQQAVHRKQFLVKGISECNR